MPSPEIPEPEPNATLRLPAGEPVNPYSTLPLDLSKHLDAGRTLKLPLGAPEPAPDSTQRLLLTRPDEAPLRVQKEDQPVETAGRTQKLPVRPAAPRPLGWKVPLGLVLLAGLAGGGVYVAFFRVRPAPPAPPPASAPRAEAIPPAARATLEQAEAGDVRAMHLLGLMYYNGLNVPQDREKGLHWLRKAAAQGSAGARAELSQIEGGR